MITINRNLNLVIPIARGESVAPLYVVAMPIGPEVFDTYHMVLAKTFSAFANSNIIVTSAPSIAQMVLKDVAKSTMRAPGLDWWDGVDGVENGLLAEIVRLSNVIMATDNGWQTIPLQTALDQNRIDADEKSEVVNLLAFFTVISRVPPRSEREGMLRGMANLYNLECTSLNATAYASSLKTWTPAEITGESSQPS